jgi:ABC-type polysaccharide/polyol phosphate transport system ATPase subunit
MTTTKQAAGREQGAEQDAIVVTNLTKHFRRRHRRGSFKLAILGRQRAQYIEEFTALDSISFRVPHGQTVAVIGRNGSGKSTLLGILSRVYRPTAGEFHLYNAQGGPARIAPLLELGAGFHPELTGLENIEFYGAVLGMTSRELTPKKVGQIIAFAELADRIDTPVRGWNYGALLRLGFSIAVHSDPDILLVDEVLAVGDEAFQNKCYRLIAEMQTRGVTILFVSHDLPVVERVAGRVLWLNQGLIQMDGDVSTVLSAYREAAIEQENAPEN